MKKIIVLLSTLMVLVFGQVAFGFGISDVSSIAGAGTEKSVEAGPLVAQLNETMFNLNTSQQYIFTAFNLKDDAAQAFKDGEEYKKPNSINTEAYNRSGKSNKKIADLMSKGEKLTDEGKKNITLALPSYGKALARSAGLAAELTSAAQVITANPMSVVAGPFSAVDLIKVFTTSPVLLKEIVSQGYTLVSYADKNDIDHKNIPGFDSNAGKDVK